MDCINLDDHVADTIPSWRYDPRKSRITIRQLLDFSAGLDPAFHLHNDDPGDRDAIAIARPIVAEPGSRFIYGPAALQVFHGVLKAKLRGESPERYLERRVLRRLGLGSQRYLKDRAGNSLLAAGWMLSARQWAKLGELVLNEGAPVVSPGFLAQSWRGSPPNRAYSLGWWNNRAAPGGREFDFEEALTPKWQTQNLGRRHSVPRRSARSCGLHWLRLSAALRHPFAAAGGRAPRRLRHVFRCPVPPAPPRAGALRRPAAGR